MSNTVVTSVQEGVALVRLDDGKVNVISHDVIDALHAALDQAEKEATAVAVLGREGKLSGGFDLSVMTASPADAQRLVHRGGELLMRLYGHPQPVVIGVTGHALAAGALLVLACDTRIGAEGDFKIGLNETAIGMALPEYAVELARERLSKRWFARCALQAEILDPRQAVDAGFLDRIVPAGQVEQEVVAEAARLGALRAGAYRVTKEKSRQAMVDRVVANLESDLAGLLGP